MKKTKMKGAGVGDLRLAPLDVGFDVRPHGMAINLPAEFKSAGIDIKGQTYLIEGTREEMIREIKKAGYKIGARNDLQAHGGSVDSSLSAPTTK